MYLIIWEYRVRPQKRLEFEKFYGPKGDWAKLFAQSPGYLGTSLYDVSVSEEKGEKLARTEDRWESKAHFQRFLEEHKSEYAQLDKIGDELTVSEMKIGEFER